jgi:hypothetical protein
VPRASCSLRRVHRLVLGTLTNMDAAGIYEHERRWHLRLAQGKKGVTIAHEPDLRCWGAIAARAHDPKAPSRQAGSSTASYCTQLSDKVCCIPVITQH